LLSDAETGKNQAACWRQFSAVDPDLNYILWRTTTASADFAVNMARNTDPKVQSALELGRSSTEPTIRAKAYQVLNKRLAIDLPTCGLTGPWSARRYSIREYVSEGDLFPTSR
jgi:hypothetical protein